MSTLPLAGIRVLDLSRLLPGPLCSLMLADLGADIVKIEAPRGGDYTRWFPPVRENMSGAFAALNRNKRSLALDLKTAAGVDTLLHMVVNAEVLLEGFRPAVMKRLGLDYETLRTIKPDLIYCSISGYGQDGPLFQRAGHDINYLARTGVLSLTGSVGGPPVVPGVQLADVTGGSWMGVSHILSALFRRERTGEGCFCDVAMCEGLLPFLTMELGQRSFGADSSDRGEGMLTGGMPCYGVYRCGDGKYLSIGSLEPKFWLGLVSALGLEHLSGDGLSMDPDGESARAAVEKVLATKSRDEWAAFLAAYDVCVEPVLELDEVMREPHAQARGYFVTHEHPTEGQVVGPRTPFRMDSVLPPAHKGAPLLGEHSTQILREFDFSEEEIQALHEAGVVLSS